MTSKLGRTKMQSKLLLAAPPVDCQECGRMYMTNVEASSRGHFQCIPVLKSPNRKITQNCINSDANFCKVSTANKSRSDPL